jgi:hypothetical protein
MSAQYRIGVVNGVRQDVRRLTISVYEHKVNSAVRRGLLQATVATRGP